MTPCRVAHGDVTDPQCIDGRHTAKLLGEIIITRKVGGIVIGLPKNMDGSEGPSAQSARTFARNLLASSVMADLPVTFWDERLSTAAVERAMIEQDVSRQKRDAKIDQAAAAYILQGVLDALRLQSKRS